jgi:hypothetical protein
MKNKSLGLGILLAVAVGACNRHETPEHETPEHESSTVRPSIFHVDASHALASDDNQGTASRPLKTIQAGADRAGPGDTVLVHEGVYRETIVPPRGGDPGRPIVYRAAPGESVVITGTETWNALWTRDPDSGLYSSPIDLPVVDDYNPFALALNLAPDGSSPYVEFPVRPVAEGGEPVCTMGQLFVKGKNLPQRRDKSEVRKHKDSWCVSRDGKRIWLNPGSLVGNLDAAVLEASVRPQLFRPDRRGLGHIHLRGLIFEGAANPGPMPQAGMVSTRTGHHWIIEHCTLRHAKTIGLDCGGETVPNGAPRLRDTAPEQRVMMTSHSHIVRYNRIQGNGVCGMAALYITNSIFYGNILDGNAHLLDEMSRYKTERMSWNEWGALKAHGFKGGLIFANRFERNRGSGLFLDTHYGGAVVSGNLFADEGHHGVIFERDVRGDTFCVNNVFYHTNANDIRTMDVSRLTVAHNLFLGEGIPTAASVYFKFNMIPGAWGGGAGVHVAIRSNRVCNNVFADTAAIELPDLVYTNRFNHYRNPVASDYNAYVNRPEFYYHSYDFIESSQKARHIERWFVSLDQWVENTGNELHSAILSRDVLRAVRLEGDELMLDVGPGFFRLETSPDVRITCDYFGKPMDAIGRPPGPFQNLKPGVNRLVIWPPKVDDALVEKLVAEKRIQDLIPVVDPSNSAQRDWPEHP